MADKHQAVFFHVGLPKTASTYLQNQVFPNLRDIHFTRKSKTKYYPKILSENPSGKYLFSCEYDWALPMELDKLKKNAPQAKVIIVFRSHSSWIKSKYTYHIRKHGNASFREFFNIYNDSGEWKIQDLLYYPKIELITSRFSNEPLVLIFEDLKKNPQSFINQIVSYTGVSCNTSKISNKRVNKAFSPKQLTVLLWFNNFYKYKLEKYPKGPIRNMYYKYRQFLLHIVAFFAQFLPVKAKELIPPDDLKKIDEYFKEDWGKCLRYARKQNFQQSAV